MNVLKVDFTSKQKRMQGRRQKVFKTFFSGYHTISNILPPATRFKMPVYQENNATNQMTSSASPSSFLDTEESGKEPLDLGSAASTSLEFQKIMESFVNVKQDYIPEINSERKDNTFRSFGALLNEMCHLPATLTNKAGVDNDDDDDEHLKRIARSYLQFPAVFQHCERRPRFADFSREKFFPKFGEARQKFLDAVPQNQEGIDVQQYIHQNTPKMISEPNKNPFEQYSIFTLPVPRKQKSMEEVLSERIAVQPEVSEEVISETKNKSSPFEMETPKAKPRKSPKISGSNKTLASESGTFILAVTEGRGHARGEVGIAAMDPKRPHLVLCQISDSQRYLNSLAKMNVFDFVEVIVPNTFVDCASPNKLYSDIRSAFPKVTLTSVQRRHFNESIGVDLIRQYCSPESNSVMVLTRDKFYALSSAAALIRYVEFTQNVRLAPQSLKIEYQGKEDTMIIDLNTANLLELVLCMNHPETNSNHSLLGVVKHCHTKGGVRLLRANILQPPCSLSKIETRLDSVSELVGDPILLCTLEAAVSSFSNVEDLLNLCMHTPQQEGLRAAEYQLKYTLLLKTVLELIPSLLRSLQSAKSTFFCEMRKNLEDPRYFKILERILQTVFENAKNVKGSVAAHLHGCFAIKTGINSLLDVAKKTYCEIVQEISDHVNKLRERHEMPLRLAFSGNKGFHIQFTLPRGQRAQAESSLPKEFILVQKSKTTFSFYTAELVALDQRSQHVLNEIKLMTNMILFDLLMDIRQHIGCLFNLCEYIAELDVLISFAHVGSGTDYSRPKFGDKLELKASRHPILDVICDGEVVPNDVFAKPGKNFTILTGPNQSGKSIYIRQIALLQIMAQMGCYVPAKEATFRLTDRIFSRISFDDSIESNASTLIVEMRDIEYLKQNRTPRSLVIIDELCRGTSVEEGTSLAFAICEELLDTSTFVFLTTHYLLLTKLEEMYFNITNYHFESEIELGPGGRPSLRFTHVRTAGATKADTYGLQLAEMTSFPKDVYNKAKDISARLSGERKPCRAVSGLLGKYELSLRLRSELLTLESEMNWEKMESVIKRFKELYDNLKNEELLKQKSSKTLETTQENDSSGFLMGSSAIREKDKSPCFIVRRPRDSRLSNSPGFLKNTSDRKSSTRKMAVKIKQKYKKLLLARRKDCHNKSSSQLLFFTKIKKINLK